MSVRVRILHSRGLDMVGYLPMLLDEQDLRPARAQLHDNYQHGGGWRPMDGWTFDHGSGVIKYPGDPELGPIAEMWLRKERILVYLHAWVVIAQPDGHSFEIARMD